MNYQRLYEYRFRDVDQAVRTAVWEEISAYLYERLGRPERVLDPAAGRGEFINAVPAPERWAVDQVAHTQGTYGAGVRSIVSDVFDVELPAGHFDGIFVSNFLEHLSTQEAVGQFLVRMREASVAGGRIAVMGPNFRHCRREYFDMADHTLIFTHRAIAEHLYAAGFEPRSGGVTVSAVLVHRTAASLAGAHAPIFATPLAWRLLGKQFLVIGRRA